MFFSLSLALVIITRVVANQATGFCPRTNVDRGLTCTQAECIVGNANSCHEAEEMCICDGDCGYSCFKPNLKCGKLKKYVRNGRVVRSKHNYFNSTYKTSCKPGYVLIGSPVRTCRGNGYWDGSQPTCTKRCSDPGKSDGLVMRLTGFSPTGFPVGAKLRYYCPPKYIPIGSRLLRCKSNSRWTSRPPTCKEPICTRAASLPENTLVLRQKKWKQLRNFGVRLTLSCRPGYNRISGSIGTLQCITPGWKLLPPTFKCFPKSCGDPGYPRHGKRDGHLFTFKEKVTFSCDHCYKLSEPSYRICQADQKWSDAQPTCKPARCLSPQIPKNGRVNVRSRSCGGKATYSCYQGYQLYGPAIRTCQSDETWSGEEPSCYSKRSKPVIIATTFSTVATTPTTQGKIRTNAKRIRPKLLTRTSTQSTYPTPRPKNSDSTGSQCGQPKLPTGAKILKTKGKIITLGCKKGFSLLSRGILICYYKDNEWKTYRKVRCIQKGCSNPGTPKHGNKNGLSYQYGDHVKFWCKKCYKLIGDSVRTCLRNGTWNGIQPTCKAITCPNIGHNNETQVEYSSVECGATAKYTCYDKSMTLLGPTERRCGETGLWSGNKPKCVDNNLNIALHRRTTQSSNDSRWIGPSSRAVDGNRNPNYYIQTSCTHTAERKYGAWWRVDLGKQEPVAMVIVVNRKNDNRHWRLNDFKITVGDDTKYNGRNNPVCGGNSRPGPGEIMKIKCAKILHGRYVSVVLPKKTNEPLTLCEVEVYRKIKH